MWTTSAWSGRRDSTRCAGRPPIGRYRRPVPTPPQHYFSSEPDVPEQRRELHLSLAGRDVTVQTSGGVFCPDRLDLGTSVLLREAPDPPDTGTLLDLGCGWGPLALTMAMRSPDANVWAVDVNRRAVRLTADNAAALGLAGVRAALPHDVPADLTFDCLWSNPPIRIGKSALHELLLAWLPRLAPGGQAYLVVQRNLGSDSLQTWLVGTLGPDYLVSRHASAKGFRVLRIERPDPRPVTPA